MVTVMLDMFSGRPNPSFELLPSETQTLFTAILANPQVISTKPAASILGFRGLEMVLDATSSARSGLPERFRIGDGAAEDPVGSAALAETMIRSIPVELGTQLGTIAPRTEPPLFVEENREAGVESTGQSDVGPTDTSTTLDVCCSYELGRYNPVFWNSPNSVRFNNNCYAYACNMRTDTYPQPGRHSKQPHQHTLASVIASALSDGLARRDDCMPVERKPRWIVALVTKPDNCLGWDYHWYRRQLGCNWAHKPGQTLVTDRDQTGKVITDPKNCERGGYTVWGGYFWVPQTANISLA